MNTDNNKSPKFENVVVIGGGPAGLAASVYLARASMNPLLFAGSPPGGQLTLTTEVENYPGYESILGPELIEKMRGHAKKFGTRIIDENVLGVDFSKRPFTVTLREGANINVGAIHESPLQNTVLTKSVLIATGAKAIWLGLESETRLRGKGVSACATCDGFFFRNKIVAVVGGGDTALEEALTLTKVATKVYVIHRRDAFRASKIMQDRVLHHEKIEVIWDAEVVEVTGNLKVEGIQLKIKGQNELRSLPLEGLFIAIGHKPDTELFKDKVVVDEKGYIQTSSVKALEIIKSQSLSKVNQELEKKLIEQTKTNSTNFDFEFQTMTSVPGVFAAGDNVDHVYRQAATAVGMGVAAALDLERWLLLQKE